MKALVTGFDPFGGDALNASREAVQRLPSQIGRLEIAIAQLPTSFARAPAVLLEAIATVDPALVLCVGEAGERGALCVERVAVNIQDARIPDNDGAQPVDAPVVPGGPSAYLSTLPVRTVIGALNAAELPAEISMSAGTFVCNHVFYSLMHLSALRGQPFRGGFLHVPRLPGPKSSGLAMTLEDITLGICIVLEASAEDVRHLPATDRVPRKPL